MNNFLQAILPVVGSIFFTNGIAIAANKDSTIGNLFGAVFSFSAAIIFWVIFSKLC